MPSITKINAFGSESGQPTDPGVRELLGRCARSFGPHAVLFYSNPLQLVRSEGIWLFDHEGRPYLDAYNNVPQVGHCNPKVVQAVARQLAKINIHTRYLNEDIYNYTEQLLATFPDPLRRLSLTCTGSESVDLAMRMAYSVTGATGFIVTRYAYHGNTVAVSSISPSIGPAVAVGSDVRLVDPPDTYRNPNVNIERRLAEHVDCAIADLGRHGVRLAAMIVDTVFSSDGVFVDPAGFLRTAADRVRQAGALFIADEVQPGFGRTGCHMWGFQRHGITPDVVVMGKPMGNGIPIGGVVTTPEILNTFGKSAGYFNTFGGNPVSCAAGKAVLDVLIEENLMSNAAAVGSYLKSQLQGLSRTHPCIGDVRGAGLFLSVDLVQSRETREPDGALAPVVINGLRERGVLVGGTGPSGNMLKIRPPLIFSRENADLLVSTLDEVLGTSAHR